MQSKPVMFFKDCKTHQVLVKVLLETGSQNSFITDKLFKKLGVKPFHGQFNISRIGLTDSVAHKMVNVAIRSEVSNNHLQM